MLYKKDSEGRLENCKEDWPKAYYEETNPFVRKEMLVKIEASDITDEILTFRKEIWEARYGKDEKQQGQIDYFIRGLVYLKSVFTQMDALFAKKRCKSMLEDAKKDLLLDQYKNRDAAFKMAVEEEWKNLAEYYFNICVEDKNFSTGALGLFKLKDDEIINKIAEEVLTIMVRVPMAMNQKEDFEEISKIFIDVFSATFYQGRLILDEKMSRIKDKNNR